MATHLHARVGVGVGETATSSCPATQLAPFFTIASRAVFLDLRALCSLIREDSATALTTHPQDHDISSAR